MMQVRSLVGYTSSQKPIYQYDAADIRHVSHDVADYSIEDYFDAVAVFDYLDLLYWRKYGESSKEYNNSRAMMVFYDARISREYKEQRRVELRLLTAFDLSNYGRKHCVPYLQELIGN
jgi:hypothetical protein